MWSHLFPSQHMRVLGPRELSGLQAARQEPEGREAGGRLLCAAGSRPRAKLQKRWKETGFQKTASDGLSFFSSGEPMEAAGLIGRHGAWKGGRGEGCS